MGRTKKNATPTNTTAETIAAYVKKITVGLDHLLDIATDPQRIQSLDNKDVPPLLNSLVSNLIRLSEAEVVLRSSEEKTSDFPDDTSEMAPQDILKRLAKAESILLSEIEQEKPKVQPKP